MTMETTKISPLAHSPKEKKIKERQKDIMIG
jgi:hypothetical protein